MYFHARGTFYSIIACFNTVTKIPIFILSLRNSYFFGEKNTYVFNLGANLPINYLTVSACHLVPFCR